MNTMRIAHADPKYNVEAHNMLLENSTILNSPDV